MNLKELDIKDARHVELVDRFTRKDPQQRWTVAQSLVRSQVFDTGASTAAGGSRAVGGGSEILLDAIELHKRPEGTCWDQLKSVPDVRCVCLAVDVDTHHN